MSQPPSTSPWPSVHVGRDLRRARREWLHTNGAGAYASSTLAGMHSRRYHGLLVAALEPPRGRHVFLSHVDVTVVPRDGSSPAPSSRRGAAAGWDLAKHQFPRVDPETGPFYLERFDQDPLPRWTHAVAGAELEVTLGLVRGHNAVVLRYAWSGAEPAQLKLRPLLAARGYHELLREHGGMLQRVELRPGEMRVQPKKDLPRICFRYEGTFVGSPDWWRRFEYLAERERGLDFEEDLWTPGVVEVTVGAQPVWLVAAIDKLPDGEPEALFEATRQALLAEDPGPRTPLTRRRLTIAAEAFRADLAQKPAILAGYPWYEVWGSDALMALAGLYLVPGKPLAALRVLRELIAGMKDGLVPTRLPDATGAAEYHAADATLWLFEAARLLAETLGDGHPFVTDELLLALRDAFEATLRGAPNGAHLTADGLFAAGRAGDPLTWMHARVAGQPVTPRAGCPIELSALWARGCDTLARLARAAGDSALQERAVAECQRTRRAFHARFWCDETGYPYDVLPEVEGEAASRDASVRPNAVIALAIDPACFTPAHAEQILERVERELITPAGLRTLAPSDPRYRGTYAGGVATRDGARHQGSAWPFLLGFYVRAAARAGRDLGPVARLVESAIENAVCVGQVPELAGGDAPHLPGGCVAQATSVAELLRIVAWDLPAAREAESEPEPAVEKVAVPEGA